MSEERMVPIQNVANGPSGSQDLKIGKAGKSLKSFEGIGGYHKDKDKKDSKDWKKGKRYKEDKGKVVDKLMKSTKTGKVEKNFSYDPYQAEDDTYSVPEEFDFNDWRWEFVPQDEHGHTHSSTTPFESSNSGGGVMSLLSDPTVVSSNGVGGLMGRVEAVTEEGQYQFSNFLAKFNDPVVPVILSAPHKVGNYKFNFPTIHHTIYSGPVHLKAHSETDLGPFDPEIFSVLQSMLTPYLQEKMGPTLHAYNLEVDYSPGRDISVGKDDVVTLMEVKVTLKVISDSLQSLRTITSKQASRWIHDFFDGPDLYKLLEALESGNMPIIDIAFLNQEFQSTTTISEANSQSFGISRGQKPYSEKSSDPVAMIGITMSVVVVGLIFFMHYTGRLPSKAQMGDFTLNTRDSFSQRMSSSMSTLKRKMRRKDDEMEGGRRRRTFSGTFRRFPTGGLQKAKIQKKPAKSEQFLKDDASAASSVSGPPMSYKSGMDDYTLSHYGRDYGPATPSRQSMIPMTPVGQRSDDEFSMPSTYESPADERSTESLLGKVGKTAAYLMSPTHNERSPTLRSPFPSRAARRVTASDIASPNDVDNWSIRSYESDGKSNKSQSNHPLVRGWNESGPELQRPEPPVEDGSARRERLSLPFFS